MSAFNPETFLDQSTTEQGTRRPPISSGLDFIGVIGEPKARVNPGKKDPTQTYTFCDVPITLDLSTHPTEAARVGADKVTLRHSFSLDFTESGALDWNPGKNRVLTAYREILGLNQSGQTFSPRMLVGRIIRAKVKHRTNEGDIYDEIDSVAKP
jgi:hypothetical protein